MKILLDAGHGAGSIFNRGFKQVDNLPYCNEGDCNFIYAKNYLKPALEKYGIYVGLTRNDIKENPSLKARGEMGKGYDLLLSCHTNAANGVARGVEVWDSTNPAESCKKLGDAICAAISKTLNTPNRGTKYRKDGRGRNYYGILRYGAAKKNMIIEHVFHDNLKDATIYRKNLDKVANAVADTIAGYFGLNKGVDKMENRPSEWAEKAWKWGIEKGLTDGTNPQGTCTREQVITMLYRALADEAVEETPT